MDPSPNSDPEVGSWKDIAGWRPAVDVEDLVSGACAGSGRLRLGTEVGCHCPGSLEDMVHLVCPSLNHPPFQAGHHTLVLEIVRA